MPLRDDFATCPHDGAALDRDPDDRKLSCKSCGGGLVQEAEVSRVLAEILRDAPQTLPLEPPTAVEPSRTCPRCLAQMTKHSLYEIQVDRCGEHGLWFDAEEMQRVLHVVGLEVAKQDAKFPLAQKLTAGGVGIALLAANLIRFIFFMPR